MDIGEKIKALRSEKGMTQRELAEKSGLSRMAIGNYERNYRIPTLDVLEQIANALDIATFELLGGKADPVKLTKFNCVSFLLNELGYNVGLTDNCEYRIYGVNSFENKTDIKLTPAEFITFMDSFTDILDFSLAKLIKSKSKSK